MMKKIAIGLIVALLIALFVIYLLWPEEQVVELPKVAEPTTSRITTEGEYVGFMDKNGARAWLGLPFAKPPIGDLRWVAPEPPDSHTGIQEALAFSDPCVQYPNPTLRTGSTVTEGIVGSEDCLYLNIWSPPNAIDAPVMFWIHGGGNSIGEAAVYNASTLAAKHKIVVVTTNYRLGIFGWFNHPDLLAMSEQSSGNFGTLDLVRALEWVRDNIRSFGGNPNNVTVFGESAGGVNTLSLVITDRARGLFHRAISQSGAFGASDPKEGYLLSSEGGHTNSAREIANRLMVADKLAVDEAQAATKQAEWGPQELTKYLKSKSAAEVYATLNDDQSGLMDFPAMFGDNTVLPMANIEEIFGNTRNFNDVPIILGTNRDEPTLFMMQAPQYVSYFLGVFPSIEDENDYRRVVYYGAQAWKVRGVDNIASVMRSSGHSEVYAYRFDWDEEPSSFFFDLSLALGAGHAIEIPFVFGDFSMLSMLSNFFPNDAAQFALSESMMSYWAEFAYNGNPGRGRDGTEVPWTPFGEKELTTLLLDTAADGGIRMMKDRVTYASLREEMLNDTSFNNKDTYCRTYITTFRDTPVYETSDLETIGCSHIDPATVGWY